MKYLVRRLVTSAVLLFVISATTFALAEVAPGDFLSAIELDPQVSKETIEALRERYGLDRSGVERYFAWLRSVAAGDLGYSLAYEVPVADLLLPRARNTLLLMGVATALAWALSLFFGTWAASREGGWLDRSAVGASAVLLAIPELVLGLGCLALAVSGDHFPLGGMSSLDYEELGLAGRLRDLARHLALPVTALVLAMFPVLFAHVRSAVLEVIDAPFLRAARGHGLRPARLLFRYALPAAAAPLLSLLGLSIASLLSGSLVIEVLFAWPGIGNLLIDSVTQRDLHVLVGTTCLSAALVVLGQLVADLFLYAADPRIREAP